jgi:hypothetical protein
MKHACGITHCERPAVCSVWRDCWLCAEHYDEMYPNGWLPGDPIVAPDIPAEEIMALRAHIDEAKGDPDYSII